MRSFWDLLFGIEHRQQPCHKSSQKQTLSPWQHAPTMPHHANLTGNFGGGAGGGIWLSLKVPDYQKCLPSKSSWKLNVMLFASFLQSTKLSESEIPFPLSEERKLKLLGAHACMHVCVCVFALYPIQWCACVCAEVFVGLWCIWGMEEGYVCVGGVDWTDSDA